MPVKNTPETEIHTLLEDIANQLRFLTGNGVSFVSAEQMAVPRPSVPVSSSAPHPSVVSDTHVPESFGPESSDTAKAGVIAPSALESPGAGQPSRGHQPLMDPSLHRQLTLSSHSKADDETLSRTPVNRNQPAHTASKPQQNSLFGEVPPASLPVSSDVTLEAIRADLGDCQRCKLAAGRTNIVFGEGAARAPVVFVGEGPGAEEDATGRPFVGRAGQLLDKIIAAMGLRREEVYICNVVKCRPPENRTPEPDEVAACVGFLHRQLAVIRPHVIVALGASAASALLGNPKLGGISKIRGRFQDYHGIPLMPTFHPAYLLRAPDKKREVWEDIKQVMALLRERQTDAH
jgi:uracil-DNA glycosylase family 4